jgi:hypothetical protein
MHCVASSRGAVDAVRTHDGNAHGLKQCVLVMALGELLQSTGSVRPMSNLPILHLQLDLSTDPITAE